MFRRPGPGWTAVAIVLTASAGVSARADDANPATEPSKAAAGGSETPEQVLAARGLTRSGTRYVLSKREAECFKKFDEIRPLYQNLESSYNKLAAVAMSEAQVAELQLEQKMLQQQIQALGSRNSMSRYSGKYGGRYARYARNPTQQLQQQMRAQQGVLSRQLTMAKQAVPTKQKQETTALFERQRSALLASSSVVREMFETLKKEYSEVEHEGPVHSALESLRKAAKAQLKIAPSAEFEKKLAQLKKLERMMQPPSASQGYPAAGKSQGKRSKR